MLNIYRKKLMNYNNLHSIFTTWWVPEDFKVLYIYCKRHFKNLCHIWKLSYHVNRQTGRQTNKLLYILLAKNGKTDTFNIFIIWPMVWYYSNHLSKLRNWLFSVVLLLLLLEFTNYFGKANKMTSVFYSKYSNKIF